VGFGSPEPGERKVPYPQRFGQARLVIGCDAARVSWFDTKLGRLASAFAGLVLLVLDWPNGTINPVAGPLILGAIPRSPLVRGHVEFTTFTLIGLYGVGVGVWLGRPVPVFVGAALIVAGGVGEVWFCLATRPQLRLPDQVVSAIANGPGQFGMPRYDLRLANGDIVYWPVIGGAYLGRHYRRYRLDFSPRDVVDLEPVPREPAW
jgi:hypothetical protein